MQDVIKDSIPKSQLLKIVLDLLHNRPQYITYYNIAQNTGITESWIKALMAKPSRIHDPGVAKIEAIYKYFKKNEPITFA